MAPRQGEKVLKEGMGLVCASPVPTKAIRAAPDAAETILEPRPSHRRPPALVVLQHEGYARPTHLHRYGLGICAFQ
jgi:hypothetical protein